MLHLPTDAAHSFFRNYTTYVLSVLRLRNRLFEYMRLRINHGICGQTPSSHGGNVHVVLLGFWTDVAGLTGVFDPRLAYAVDCCLSPRPLASLLLAVSIRKRLSIIFTAKSQLISYCFKIFKHLAKVCKSLFTPENSEYKIDKFSKITNWVKLKNKQNHSKVLLSSFPMNGHSLGFWP